jgi:hypothetical protein
MFFSGVGTAPDAALGSEEGALETHALSCLWYIEKKQEFISI